MVEMRYDYHVSVMSYSCGDDIMVVDHDTNSMIMEKTSSTRFNKYLTSRGKNEEVCNEKMRHYQFEKQRYERLNQNIGILEK